MRKYFIIILVLGLFVSCTEVEFCETEHPHSDKLVVNLDWSNVSETVARPKNLSLYLWRDGKFVETQNSAPCDDQFVIDLPSVGKYQMMLLSPLDNVTLENKEKFTTIVARGGFETYLPNDAQTKIKAPGNLFIVPLGNIEVPNNDAIIIKGKVSLGVRPVEFVISVNNAAFLIDQAYATLGGNATDLLLYKNESTNVSINDVLIPLNIGASSIQSGFSTFGAAEGVKQLLTVHIYPKNGIYQTETIDITKHVTDFEVENPSKSAKLVILADAQVSFSAQGTKFKITTISVNGQVVERGGDI